MIPNLTQELLAARDARPLTERERELTCKTLIALGVRQGSQLWEVYTNFSVNSFLNYDPSHSQKEVALSLLEVLFYGEGEDGNEIPLDDEPRETVIGMTTAYVREVWSVPDCFVCLSSTEGEGAYLYDVSSEKVFEFELGQHEELASGSLHPRWKSFWEFLDWFLQT